MAKYQIEVGDVVRVTQQDNVFFATALTSGHVGNGITVSINGTPVRFSPGFDDSKVQLYYSGEAGRKIGAKEAIEKAVILVEELALDIDDTVSTTNAVQEIVSELHKLADVM